MSLALWDIFSADVSVVYALLAGMVGVMTFDFLQHVYTTAYSSSLKLYLDFECTSVFPGFKAMEICALLLRIQIYKAKGGRSLIRRELRQLASRPTFPHVPSSIDALVSLDDGSNWEGDRIEFGWIRHYEHLNRCCDNLNI